MTTPLPATERKDIAEALWGYGLDPAKTALIDTIIQTTVAVMHQQDLQDQKYRDLIALRNYGLALRSRDFAAATGWARSVGEEAMRMHLLQKAGGYAASDPASTDLARAAFLCIETPSVQASCLCQLSLAQVVRGDPEKARQFARDIKDPSMQTAFNVVGEFVIQHVHEPLEQVMKLAPASDPGVYRQRMALYYAAQNNLPAMIEVLGYNKQTASVQETKTRANVTNFFATILGWAGLPDQALELDNAIQDPQLRLMQTSYLASLVPLPPASLEAIHLETGKGPFAPTLITPILIQAYSDQMGAAMTLLRSIGDGNSQAAIFHTLVGNLFDLLGLSQGRQPVPVAGTTPAKKTSGGSTLGGIVAILFGLGSLIFLLGALLGTTSTNWPIIFSALSSPCLIAAGIGWLGKKPWANLVGGLGLCLFSFYGFGAVIVMGSSPVFCGSVSGLFLIGGVLLIFRYFNARQKEDGE